MLQHRDDGVDVIGHLDQRCPKPKCRCDRKCPEGGHFDEGLVVLGLGCLFSHIHRGHNRCCRCLLKRGHRIWLVIFLACQPSPSICARGPNGLATLILLARGFGWIGGSNGALVEKAELKPRIYSDERIPIRISEQNIWRWFYLRSIIVGVDVETKKRTEHQSALLFLSFDRSVAVGTLEVTSDADALLPRHEVKEFNNRYAIIHFAEMPPAGILDITVRP